MQNKLTDKTINLIKESAAIITKYSPQITLRMYVILFDKHPEMKKIFENSPEDQYMKLAQALSAYAVNIEKLHILTPALEMIAKDHNKHNVLPSHYPIVGMALIEAMEDILNDNASLELIDAWREAYKHLASVLIELQKKVN